MPTVAASSIYEINHHVYSELFRRSSTCSSLFLAPVIYIFRRHDRVLAQFHIYDILKLVKEQCALGTVYPIGTRTLRLLSSGFGPINLALSVAAVTYSTYPFHLRLMVVIVLHVHADKLGTA